MAKKTLITGATSGIGREFAQIFAEKGYDLILVSRSKEKLTITKNEIENKFDISVEIMEVDLSNVTAASEVFEAVSKKTSIDVLVNNAGNGIQGEHTTIEIQEVDKMIGLNITTLTHLCSLFGNEMKKNGGGHILNVSSTGAYQPAPYFATYAAAKSYVLNFSEALAKELEDDNVVVTCLSPGLTDTNFFNAAGIGDKSSGFWANSARMDPKRVAAFGIKALFKGKLSVIPGFMNSSLIFTNRIVPRSISANIGKKLVKKAAEAK